MVLVDVHVAFIIIHPFIHSIHSRILLVGSQIRCHRFDGRSEWARKKVMGGAKRRFCPKAAFSPYGCTDRLTHTVAAKYSLFCSLVTHESLLGTAIFHFLPDMTADAITPGSSQNMLHTFVLLKKCLEALPFPKTVISRTQVFLHFVVLHKS